MEIVSPIPLNHSVFIMEIKYLFSDIDAKLEVSFE
jgi:hypothetical protein